MLVRVGVGVRDGVGVGVSARARLRVWVRLRVGIICIYTCLVHHRSKQIGTSRVATVRPPP